MKTGYYYEIKWEGIYSFVLRTTTTVLKTGTLDQKIYFVQCKAILKSRIHFKIIASTETDPEFAHTEILTLRKAWDWTSKRVSPKDALLYIGFPTKTKAYDKLLTQRRPTQTYENHCKSRRQ